MVLERDLIKRGAKRDAIENALCDVEESVDDALVILKKYLRGKTIDKQTLYKGFKHLLSKGFSYDTINSAMDEFGGEDEDFIS
jgi:SOS response regulatory protein OraA/RecX